MATGQGGRGAAAGLLGLDADAKQGGRRCPADHLAHQQVQVGARGGEDDLGGRSVQLAQRRQLGAHAVQFAGVTGMGQGAANLQPLAQSMRGGQGRRRDDRGGGRAEIGQGRIGSRRAAVAVEAGRGIQGQPSVTALGEQGAGVRQVPCVVRLQPLGG